PARHRRASRLYRRRRRDPGWAGFGGLPQQGATRRIFPDPCPSTRLCRRTPTEQGSAGSRKRAYNALTAKQAIKWTRRQNVTRAKVIERLSRPVVDPKRVHETPDAP